MRRKKNCPKRAVFVLLEKRHFFNNNNNNVIGNSDDQGDDTDDKWRERSKKITLRFPPGPDSKGIVSPVGNRGRNELRNSRQTSNRCDDYVRADLSITRGHGE